MINIFEYDTIVYINHIKIYMTINIKINNMK